MITVGVIRELEFMAKAVNSDMYVVIQIANKKLSMKIWDNQVIINYEGQKIWEENIYGEGNWFGKNYTLHRQRRAVARSVWLEKIQQ